LLPAGFTRQQADEQEHQKTEHQGTKAKPNHTPGTRITINFCQDIPENVGKRKKHGSGIKSHADIAKGKTPVNNFGRGCEIGQNQNHSKTDRDNIQIFEIVALFFLFQDHSPIRLAHRVILQND